MLHAQLPAQQWVTVALLKLCGTMHTLVGARPGNAKQHKGAALSTMAS